MDTLSLYERAIAHVDDGRKPRPVAKDPRFKLLTISELYNLPTISWRVRGILPEQGIAATFGPSTSGKSFLVLDLLGAIASGRTWFGHTVKPGPCVYVALEGEAGISQRVKAYVTKHGEPHGLQVILSSLDVRSEDDRLELCDSIRAAGMAGGVLILDTLNQAAPGMDENSSRDMGEVIAALKALQTNLGGLVLVVHHAGKDATRGLRGHSSLMAALDVVLEVTHEKKH